MTGLVVWCTGLPSAGKSTFAKRVLERLKQSRVPACILDSDRIRVALPDGSSYDEVGRDRLYATLANLAALLAEQGLVVLVAATAHRRRFRERAREQAPDFVEVLLDVPLEVARARDSKGLYAAVDRKQARDVPGGDIEYERPLRPDLVADGGKDDRALDELCRIIDSRRARWS
jgi:adenylylsulfate kinase